METVVTYVAVGLMLVAGTTITAMLILGFVGMLKDEFPRWFS